MHGSLTYFDSSVIRVQQDLGQCDNLGGTVPPIGAVDQDGRGGVVIVDHTYHIRGHTQQLAEIGQPLSALQIRQIATRKKRIE